MVLDCGWKCDFEYVSIRKQNTSLQAQKSSRRRGALHHGLMQGGGSTVSPILITSTCAALGSGVSAWSEPEPSTGSEGWERTALTCQRRAIKTFEMGAEVPVDLFCISPSTSEGGWKKSPALLNFDNRVLMITCIFSATLLYLNSNSVPFSFILYQ